MPTLSSSTVARAPRLLSSALVWALAAPACDGPEDADIAHRHEISTYYLGAGSYNRKICAVDPPQATYNALVTSRKLFAEQCENLSGIMKPVPPAETSAEFCGQLDLVFKIFNGGVEGCAWSKTAKSPQTVYCYDFSGWNSEVNYKVVDVGGDVSYGSSGWQPVPGNGCPRDGFPW